MRGAVRKMQQRQPNILITGTPGTGKTTTSELLAEITTLQHINVSSLIAAQHLHDGRDHQFDAWILNEDKLCDALEQKMQQGGYIVDFHCADVFPERWFQLVVVLQADNSVLYDRLAHRGYTQKKISENIECEIMRVVLDETLNAYDERIIQLLQSDHIEQMECNVQRICQWLHHYNTRTPC